MTINQPKRKPIYAHLTEESKTGLDQLAQYHRTTLTNLLEEGARMVIHRHLKTINQHQHERQQLDSSLW